MLAVSQLKFGKGFFSFKDQMCVSGFGFSSLDYLSPTHYLSPTNNVLVTEKPSLVRTLDQTLSDLCMSNLGQKLLREQWTSWFSIYSAKKWSVQVNTA